MDAYIRNGKYSALISIVPLADFSSFSFSVVKLHALLSKSGVFHIESIHRLYIFLLQLLFHLCFIRIMHAEHRYAEHGSCLYATITRRNEQRKKRTEEDENCWEVQKPWLLLLLQHNPY